MKMTTALIAAGVLSASAGAQAQTIIQQNQGRIAPAQSGTSLSPGNVPAGQPQIGGVALPQLPADLQNPWLASQASADIFAFMALFQKLANEQRQGARESRDAAREAQYAALTDAAEKMKQAAAANMQQAQVTGAMAIASGAMSAGLAGAGAQLKPGMQGKTTTAAPGKTPTAGSQLQAPTKALTMQEKQQAAGAMASAQQGFTANMAAAEADKKKVEVLAATQAQNAQQANAQQMMQQMMDVIRDVQQKLLAIQQSQTATAQAIMRN